MDMPWLEVTGEKEICLLDFGMVCRVPLAHRRAWARCVVHLVRKDHAAVLEDLIETPERNTDGPVRSPFSPIFIHAQLMFIVFSFILIHFLSFSFIFIHSLGVFTCVHFKMGR